MRVHLGGHLNFYRPERQAWFDYRVEAPVPLEQVLAELAIPRGEVTIFILNGQAVYPEECLVVDDDTLQLYPPSQGG